jgi:hypothetical protein
MSGGNALGADLPRGDEQLIELHVVVAHGARNGRAAFEVIIDERLNHGQFEFALEIHNVKRNAQMLCDAAGVVNIVVRTATMLRPTVDILQLWQAALVPELHREAYNRLFAFVQDGCDS